MNTLRRPLVQDALVAVALTVAVQWAIWSGTTREGSRFVTVPVALVLTVALVWRRSRPALTIGLVAVAWVVQAVLAESIEAIWGLPVIFLAAYAAGVSFERRPALGAGAVTLASTWTSVLLDPRAAAGDKLITAPLFVCLPWAVGRVVRRDRERARELAVLARELEHEREERARTAVELERARLARELHDVVAHSVSVMVLQAEAGDSLIEGDPARARDSLRSIERTGRQALGELRRMLGLMRSAEGPELAPQPGLAQLESLIGEVRAAGLPVELRLDGDPAPLAPGLDLAAYRIVQEALTNALKHAHAATQVHVRYGSDAIELEIVNAAGARNGALGPGHGLVGMRERVALYGGALEAGPRPAGGFAVRARLPRQA